MDLEKLAKKVLEISSSASKAVMAVYDSGDINQENKDDGSPLTEADLNSNRIICDGLKGIQLDMPILSEEHSVEAELSINTFWLVDPLDGTKEFIRKNGEFTVNIVDERGITNRDPIPYSIEIISDIDLFVENVTSDFVVITGSNGKSTVTELLSLMCKKAKIKASAGANLGRPALDLLNDKVDLYILELSSFHLHRCQQLPAKVALLLNISNDHLDWHDGEINYHQSKYRIYKD